MKITITKRDETSIHLKSDDEGVLMEVSENFTFYAEGYRWMPAYKNKLWDGKIRLYDRRTSTLPFGLLWKLKEFCEERGYSLDFVDKATFFPPERPSKDEVLEFIKSLDLSNGRGGKLIPRDYQIDAIVTALTQSRKILVSPTGSGKSLIIYCILRWFLDNSDERERATIIVPTTSLVEQMKKDFIDYSSDDPSFDAANEVHQIYSGKEKVNFSQRVVVTTWQSAIKMPLHWFSQYSMVIGDEAHTFKAKSLNTIMSHLKKARYRIGTTGTLDGSAVNELVLVGNFGPVKKVTTTQSLIESDTLADLRIKCVVLKHPQEDCQVVSKMKYADEINVICSHVRRNEFIRNLAIAQKGNTLVLYNFVAKHGRPLYKMISDAAGRKRKVFFVSGSVGVDEREQIRQITETETDAIIVASMGTFSTGINIRNLHNIIFAISVKSQIRILQAIGRGLRKADNLQGTTVYDVSDDFSYKKSKNHTLTHAMHRVKIYQKERFKFTLHPYELK